MSNEIPRALLPGSLAERFSSYKEIEFSKWLPGNIFAHVTGPLEKGFHTKPASHWQLTTRSIFFETLTTAVSNKSKAPSLNKKICKNSPQIQKHQHTTCQTCDHVILRAKKKRGMTKNIPRNIETKGGELYNMIPDRFRSRTRAVLFFRNPGLRVDRGNIR